MAASFILNITYGLDIQSADNPYVVIIGEAMDTMSQAANPGSFMVDTIPLCAVNLLITMFTDLHDSEICTRMGSWCRVPEES
jgi:hypothetical protein